MEFIKLTDTGLKIATRQEIYDQLCIFARSAYGNDISLEDGTPFNVFLGMLADGLSTVNGATQSFSELFSTKELSGNFLDFVAGQRGVVRRVKANQRVTMTVTFNDESIPRPFLASAGTVVVKDLLGRTWVNTAQLMVQQYKFEPSGQFSETQNFQGTCEFGLVPLDGYDADLLYVNNMTDNATDEQIAQSSRESLVIVSPAEFDGHAYVVNKINATPAVQETESDAQLRARYDSAVYANAPASIEGLRSNLLKLSNFVRVIENSSSDSTVTDSNPYGLDAHSIWVIVGGGSTSDNAPTVSDDPLDVAIAQTILNYKSLGCGVSVKSGVPNSTVEIDGKTFKTGNFVVEIPLETIVAEVPFTRLVENTVTFAITLKILTYADGVLQSTVAERVSYALQQYVANLQPGEVITTVGTVEAIQSVLTQYGDGRFDFVSSVPSYSIGTGIEIYQKAIGGVAIVSFNR